MLADLLIALFAVTAVNIELSLFAICISCWCYCWQNYLQHGYCSLKFLCLCEIKQCSDTSASMSFDAYRHSIYAHKHANK